MVVLGEVLLLAACNVYDSDLLVDKKPDAVTEQRRDAGLLPAAETTNSTSRNSPGPDEFGSGDAGSENPGNESRTHCGDGQMTGAEKCDISIKAGKPGACPTECPPLDNCAPRVLNGMDCQAECVLRELVCMAGDSCCPAKCTAENDTDCSPSCGDGIIQGARGETCDPGSKTPCKQSDAECDDGNPCTTDKLMGSPTNCNSVCLNMPITSLLPGDKCCPDGANATTDSDCKPLCGNGVREADEQCDGSLGCDTSCKITATPVQLACVSAASGTCQSCACINCTAAELACRTGGTPRQNMLCSAVLDCTQKNNCLGTPCYCGDSLCIGAGPCVDAIVAAAGTADPVMVGQMQNNASTVLGKAYAADSCRVMQCQRDCRPPTGP
jgi:hypothetical protein